MAKNSKSNSSQVSKGAESPKFSRPKGFEEVSSDLAGFWDGTTPIMFKPLHAKVFDSQIEPQKCSTLIVGELLEPLVLVVGGKEDGQRENGKKGDLVGIWGKPGMLALKGLADVPVFMFPDGEADTGKPSPMKLYDISSSNKGAGKRLLITEDHRDKSRGSRSFLEDQTRGNVSETPESMAD